MFGWRQRPGIPIELIWRIKVRWVPRLLMGVSSLGSIPVYRQWVMATGYKRWSCDVAPTQLCCCCVVLYLSFSFLPSLALNGSPAGPKCSRLTGLAPAPQIPGYPALSKLGSLAEQASETPEGSLQRTNVKDILLPCCHLHKRVPICELYLWRWP